MSPIFKINLHQIERRNDLLLVGREILDASTSSIPSPGFSLPRGRVMLVSASRRPPGDGEARQPRREDGILLRIRLHRAQDPRR